MEQLFGNEFNRPNALPADIAQLQSALLLLSKQSAAPAPPLIAPSKLDKKTGALSAAAVAAEATNSAAATAAATAVSTWCAHGAVVRAQIGAAAGVKGQIEEQARAVHNKTMELFELKKDFQKQMAKNDVLSSQLTLYVKDTTALRADLDKIKTQGNELRYAIYIYIYI